MRLQAEPPKAPAVELDDCWCNGPLAKCLHWDSKTPPRRRCLTAKARRVSFGPPVENCYLNATANLGGTQGATRNRLETLKADRAGQDSIRINNQFRICFLWTPEGPVAAEITDYHW